MDETCFHYTSLGAAISILTGGQIWASAPTYLNDAEEMSPGLLIAKEKLVAAEAKDKSRYNASLSKWSHWTGKYDISDLLFVASFTALRDDLAMWRGYQQGICLEFSIKDLEKRSGAKIERVLYAEDEYRRLVDRIIANAAPSGQVLAGDLFHSAARLKSAAWSGEQEIRLVHTRRLTSSAGSPDPALKFRATDVGATPYVELPLEELDNALLRSITVGPGAFMENVKSSLRYLLTALGTPQVPILLTAVPLRALHPGR